jgi:hypothetical protein
MSKAIKTTVYLAVEVYIPESSHIADIIEEHNVALDKVQKMALNSMLELDVITNGIQDVLNMACASSKTGKVEEHNVRYTLVKG